MIRNVFFFPKRLAGASLIVGAGTLLLLVALELLLRLGQLSYESIQSLLVPSPLPAPTAGAAASGQSNWKKDYENEFQRIGMRWEPYTYWRRNEHRGDHINIASDGVRRTWSPPFLPDEAPVVLMFGGSTVWGTGARDNFTIPSLVSKQLSAKGWSLRVINMGESGYVSTQELILLITILQSGTIPDIVVFYDGFNDTYSAFQQDAAGIPQNEAHRRKEFNGLQNWWRFLVQLIAYHGNNLAIVDTSRAIGRAVLGSGAFLDKDDPDSPEYDRNSELLSHRTADIYAANASILQALAEAYGFRLFLYWQPTIYTKKSLAPQEEAIKAKLEQRRPGMDVLFAKTYSHVGLKLSSNSEWRCLANVFESYPSQLYVDECHLTEEGNAIVAQAISADIAEFLSQHGGLSGPPADITPR